MKVLELANAGCSFIAENMSASVGYQSLIDCPAVVLYFQNENCPPCKSLRPKIEGLLLSQFSKVKLEFIDASQNPECCGYFDVYAAPTILVFFDRKEVYRNGIYMSVEEFGDIVARYYELMFG